jgi:transposase
VQSLQLQVKELRDIIYGSKGEKFISDHTKGAIQSELFPEDKLGEHTVVKTTLVQYEKKKTKLSIHHPGRNPLPDTLRREIIEIKPKEDVSHLKAVSNQITEVLEYQPGELYVKRYVRPEYLKATADGLNAVRLIAPLPSFPLPKAIAGSSVLTYLLVSKFIDHLPIYRLIQIFKRQNVTLQQTTVSGWIAQACALLEGIFDLHCREVLKSNYLNVDETTIKVLDKDKKGTTHQGYYWVYYDTQKKLALFDYQPGRGAIYPQAMLQNFRGYLQSDGYDAYETFDKVEHITTLGCWAHARRKFFEAKDYDIKNAELILQEIQDLYKVEAFCRDHAFDPEQIKEYRQEHSIPILKNLNQILNDISLKTLPSSPLGKAIAYTLKRWTKLTVYAENGILQIDNNLVENSIRPVALGRKNFMFAGSHDRAQDAAMVYSFFATCRLHNINPEEWLINFLNKVNSTPKHLLYLLLPQNYTPDPK